MPKARKNPVMKHMERFNRPSTHKDKKRQAKKGVTKHKGQWPSQAALSRTA